MYISFLAVNILIFNCHIIIKTWTSHVTLGCNNSQICFLHSPMDTPCPPAPSPFSLPPFPTSCSSVHPPPTSASSQIFMLHKSGHTTFSRDIVAQWSKYHLSYTRNSLLLMMVVDRRSLALRSNSSSTFDLGACTTELSDNMELALPFKQAPTKLQGWCGTK
jgi:hypothetical protein